MELKELKLSEVKPYNQNPRRTEAVVENIKESIHHYGFRVPIIVDKDYVIITGHARYTAMQELGEKRIWSLIVDLDKEKAKEYRIADNKIFELTEWDYDELKTELRTIADIGNMSKFFNDAELKRLMKDFSGDFKVDFSDEKLEKVEAGLSEMMKLRSEEFEDNYILYPCRKCGADIFLSRRELESDEWSKSRKYQAH